MLPVLNIGPLAIPTRSLLVLMSFWLAQEVIIRLARRQRLDENAFANFGLLTIGAGLLAARLVYAAYYLSIFAQNPFALFSLTTQSMAWTEGALIGLLLGLLYLHHKQIPLRDTCDLLLPTIALLWALDGLGTFLSGDAYGQPTTMPWGIFLWEESRHPVQLYHMLASGLIAALLMWRLPHAPYRGWTALAGIALLGLTQLFLEGFRGAPAITTSGFRINQLWALAISLLALWRLYQNQRQIEQAQG